MESVMRHTVMMDNEACQTVMSKTVLGARPVDYQQLLDAFAQNKITIQYRDVEYASLENYLMGLSSQALYPFIGLDCARLQQKLEEFSKDQSNQHSEEARCILNVLNWDKISEKEKQTSLSLFFEKYGLKWTQSKHQWVMIQEQCIQSWFNALCIAQKKQPLKINEVKHIYDLSTCFLEVLTDQWAAEFKSIIAKLGSVRFSLLPESQLAFSEGKIGATLRIACEIVNEDNGLVIEIAELYVYAVAVANQLAVKRVEATSPPSSQLFLNQLSLIEATAYLHDCVKRQSFEQQGIKKNNLVGQCIIEQWLESRAVNTAIRSSMITHQPIGLKTWGHLKVPTKGSVEAQIIINALPNLSGVWLDPHSLSILKSIGVQEEHLKFSVVEKGNFLCWYNASCKPTQKQMDGLVALAVKWQKPVDLTGCDLTGVKINKGVLENCRLSGATISGACVSEHQPISHCTLSIGSKDKETQVHGFDLSHQFLKPDANITLIFMSKNNSVEVTVKHVELLNNIQRIDRRLKKVGFQDDSFDIKRHTFLHVLQMAQQKSDGRLRKAVNEAVYCLFKKLIASKPINGSSLKLLVHLSDQLDLPCNCQGLVVQEEVANTLLTLALDHYYERRGNGLKAKLRSDALSDLMAESQKYTISEKLEKIFSHMSEKRDSRTHRSAVSAILELPEDECNVAVQEPPTAKAKTEEETQISISDDLVQDERDGNQAYSAEDEKVFQLILNDGQIEHSSDIKALDQQFAELSVAFAGRALCQSAVSRIKMAVAHSFKALQAAFSDFESIHLLNNDLDTLAARQLHEDNFYVAYSVIKHFGSLSVQKAIERYIKNVIYPRYLRYVVYKESYLDKEGNKKHLRYNLIEMVMVQSGAVKNAASLAYLSQARDQQSSGATLFDAPFKKDALFLNQCRVEWSRIPVRDLPLENIVDETLLNLIDERQSIVVQRQQLVATLISAGEYQLAKFELDVLNAAEINVELDENLFLPALRALGDRVIYGVLLSNKVSSKDMQALMRFSHSGLASSMKTVGFVNRLTMLPKWVEEGVIFTHLLMRVINGLLADCLNERDLQALLVQGQNKSMVWTGTCKCASDMFSVDESISAITSQLKAKKRFSPQSRVIESVLNIVENVMPLRLVLERSSKPKLFAKAHAKLLLANVYRKEKLLYFIYQLIIKLLSNPRLKKAQIDVSEIDIHIPEKLGVQEAYFGSKEGYAEYQDTLMLYHALQGHKRSIEQRHFDYDDVIYLFESVTSLLLQVKKQLVDSERSTVNFGTMYSPFYKLLQGMEDSIALYKREWQESLEGLFSPPEKSELGINGVPAPPCQPRPIHSWFSGGMGFN